MKKIIIGVLVIIEIFSLYMMYQSNENKNLNEVNIKENNNTKFAIQYEKENGKYEEYLENEFPEGYILNKDKSKCIDEEGNVIENSLEYTNNQISFTSTNTNYCFLTFDKSMGIKLVENNPDVITSQLMNELYRYHGLNVNNYICFGASDYGTCITNQDKYLYRIIGITKEGYIKVIKNSKVGELFQWNSIEESITFENSLVFNYLSSDTFPTDDLYLDDSWQNKVVNRYWNVGSAPNYYNAPYGETISNQEKSEQSNTMFKYGLVYFSDYYYAYGNGDGNIFCSYEQECSSWLNLSTSTLTMTRDGEGAVWALIKSDKFFPSGISYNGLCYIYPVFYINNTIQLKEDSNGSIENPFIIE